MEQIQLPREEIREDISITHKILRTRLEDELESMRNQKNQNIHIVSGFVPASHTEIKNEIKNDIYNTKIYEIKSYEQIFNDLNSSYDGKIPIFIFSPFFDEENVGCIYTPIKLIDENSDYEHISRDNSEDFLEKESTTRNFNEKLWSLPRELVSDGGKEMYLKILQIDIDRNLSSSIGLLEENMKYILSNFARQFSPYKSPIYQKTGNTNNSSSGFYIFKAGLESPDKGTYTPIII